MARWSASQTLSEHVFDQLCGRETCDTRLALSCMHNAPGPTHVRILNDLPVDCTSVSLTASVCVAHKQLEYKTFWQNDETSVSGAVSLCQQIIIIMHSIKQTSSAGRIMLHFPRNADLDMPSSNHTTQQFCLPACGRVELCPVESQSLR